MTGVWRKSEKKVAWEEEEPMDRGMIFYFSFFRSLQEQELVLREKCKNSKVRIGKLKERRRDRKGRAYSLVSSVAVITSAAGRFSNLVSLIFFRESSLWTILHLSNLWFTQQSSSSVISLILFTCEGIERKRKVGEKKVSRIITNARENHLEMISQFKDHSFSSALFLPSFLFPLSLEFGMIEWLQNYMERNSGKKETLEKSE